MSFLVVVVARRACLVVRVVSATAFLVVRRILCAEVYLSLRFMRRVASFVVLVIMLGVVCDNL